jgi:pyruvate,orthophosphate dikinase
MPDVFDFDHEHALPPKELAGLLGGKGANLAEMTSVLGLPVPPGFTITTDACRSYLREGWSKSLGKEITAHLARLEERMGRRLGDPGDPLLVSVRSGARFSMPGMMDTVLNLGLNDASVLGLATQTNDERFAFDSYRRFIAMYARIVLDFEATPFDELFEEMKSRSGASSDSDVPASDLMLLVEAYKSLVEQESGAPFPQEPAVQLRGAVEAVFGSWNAPRAAAYRAREHIAEDLGTAVNVQAMVFGNRDDHSGTGVGFTRDPATGENHPYGDFLVNAQGEDVVAGIRNTEPLAVVAQRFPAIYAELREVFIRLESHYRDMCDTEFTIEQGKLWMLQTRVGKRTGRAALRMAVEMVEDDWIRLSRAEALLRVTASHVEGVLHPQFATSEVAVLTRGLGASPGAAVGRAYFTPAKAVEMARAGESVILVRSETSPEDVHGMLAAEGILTSRGGLVSHAAVVARGWGKPAVVGAQSVRVGDGRCTVGNDVIEEGDVISIDGTSGIVALGAVELSAARPSSELATLLSWADEVRHGRLGIRANADNGPDAKAARDLGARGIGLCRTEHMFLEEDRLPIVRRMILAATPKEETEALEELRIAQRSDFAEILEAMDGLPVTVRLLDPPLHEFLPDLEVLETKRATVGLTEEEQRLYVAAKEWREVNPMLGTRGVRLGVVKPGLYSMQVRALMEAALDRFHAGGRPRVEVMIPLTVSREELILARSWVVSALAEVNAEAGVSDLRSLEVAIGTMIETPRAALLAGEIAEAADFFSFGTNDLTQMTFGFSRDDVEARMMAMYLQKGLIPANPFESFDSDGVGQLLTIAVERGRLANPTLKIGVCGEHGGDPTSIEAFVRAGVDYVSCSPYRVPIARLAAAQALLRIDAESAGP